MELAIGSFNVQNLNSSAKNKEEKCERIAKMIEKADLDIVVLQEILDQQAVHSIVKCFGNQYDYQHCESLYNALNKSGLRNKNNAAFKSDYAFIWKRSKIELNTDLGLYKAIEVQIQKGWGQLIEAILEILLDAARLIGTKEDLTDSKHYDSKMLPKDNETLQAYKGRLKKLLEKTLRPPLVASFRLSRWSGFNGLLREFRIINTHTQWKKNKTDTQTELEIRIAEMTYIQKELYQIVNSYRDGNFKRITTLIAGDFNLTPQQITKRIYSQLNTMMTVQDEATTWSKNASDWTSKSYDHFAFAKEQEAEITGIMRIDDRKHLLKEEQGNDGQPLLIPISDHLPIKALLKV